MFGRMTVMPIVQLGADADLQVAITILLRAANQPEIIRWIEFPALVLLFLFVPGDQESGAAYVLDRKKGTWYMVDFEGATNSAATALASSINSSGNADFSTVKLWNGWK